MFSRGNPNNFEIWLRKFRVSYWSYSWASLSFRNKTSCTAPYAPPYHSGDDIMAPRRYLPPSGQKTMHRKSQDHPASTRALFLNCRLSSIVLYFVPIIMVLLYSLPNYLIVIKWGNCARCTTVKYNVPRKRAQTVDTPGVRCECLAVNSLQRLPPASGLT